MENIVFNIQLVKKKKIKLQKMKTFIKPGMMSSLTPRSPLKSEKKLNRKDLNNEVVPEITSLAALSRDLIRPYSIRTKDYAAISNSSQITIKKSCMMPKMPPSQIKLKPLKLKIKEPELEFYEKLKNSFLSIRKLNSSRNSDLKKEHD